MSIHTELATDLQEIHNRRQQAAEQTGLDTDKIRIVYLELNHLRQNGILVHLNIHGSSMFSAAASWLELGVVDAKIQERFTRGRKQFFRDAVRDLKSVEARLRQTLANHAYDVAGFRPFRWMPWTAYRRFREEFERLSSQMQEIKERILIDYDDEIENTRSDFVQIATVAWKSIRGQGYNPGEIMATLSPHPYKGAPGAFIDGELCTSESEFIEIITERAIAKIPTQEQIESGLSVDYSTALVYGESDSASDTLAAERIRGDLEIERARIDAERQNAYLQTRMTEQELEHQGELQKLEQERRRIEIEAMRTAEIEHARQKLQEMGSPFVDVIQQLRARIAADAQAMLESIQKNGFVRGKVAEKGRGLLDFYDLMAAHDDAQLRETLEKLSAEIGPEGTPERSIENISGILEEITILAQASSEEMRQISRASFVEV